MSRKIRVIVVDDSALVRSLLSEIINRQRDMECIGTANDPLVAREMIREMNPDVITLDVEMPRMDGIDFLGRLMRLRPMPVVMISTLTERGAEVTMKALELGAIDFVAKPRVGLASGLNDLATQIVDKIRVAAVAQVRRAAPREASATHSASGAGTAAPAAPTTLLGRLSTEKLICIGASTGGTEAIKEVLVHMPADSPGIVITQHMPPGFTPVLRHGSTACARSRSRRLPMASASCRAMPTSLPGARSSMWRAAVRTMWPWSMMARR